MSKIFSVAKELKEGKYVMIDDVPCRVVSIDSSKPGKHGAAKMRVVGMGIFDNQKKNLLVPSDADIEVPIIERKSAQVISVSGSTMQMMDTESFETYELAIPPELVGKVETGKECEMMEALGRRAVIRIKGE